MIRVINAPYGSAVHESACQNQHRRECDYGAIVDRSLSQESVKASCTVHGDHREAQHRKYTTHHHTVDASDLIAEVMYLKAALTLGLHLMRASLCEARDHLNASQEVVNRPGVIRVVHPWCSGNGPDVTWISVPLT
jgi:hypothetical protein